MKKTLFTLLLLTITLSNYAAKPILAKDLAGKYYVNMCEMMPVLSAEIVKGAEGLTTDTVCNHLWLEISIDENTLALRLTKKTIKYLKSINFYDEEYSGVLFASPYKVSKKGKVFIDRDDKRELIGSIQIDEKAGTITFSFAKDKQKEAERQGYSKQFTLKKSKKK